MKEKKNRASRGHGGIEHVRDLSTSLEAERERKWLKKLRRLRRPGALPARSLNWLVRFKKQHEKQAPAPLPPHLGPPVETLNG